MEKLNPKIKGLSIAYYAIILIIIVLARISESRLYSKDLVTFVKLLSAYKIPFIIITIAVILFIIILIKSIRFAHTNYLFNIKNDKQEKKIKNYLLLSFIYSLLVIVIAIIIHVKNIFNIAFGILLIIALNMWVIYRLKAGKIEEF